jgi:hypothetical protein
MARGDSGSTSKDFDFDRSFIHLDRRYYCGTFDAPKGSGTRTIDMSAQCGELFYVCAIGNFERQRRENPAAGK